MSIDSEAFIRWVLGGFHPFPDVDFVESTFSLILSSCLKNSRAEEDAASIEAEATP